MIATPNTLAVKHWYLYMICASDQQIYTGITTAVARRWREHLQGKAGAKYFRGRAPEYLCLLECFNSRSEASKREAEIKKLNRTAKLALIANRTANTQILYTKLALTDSNIPLLKNQMTAQD